MYVCMYAFHRCVCVYVYGCVYVCVHVCMCMYACVHVCVVRAHVGVVHVFASVCI